MFRRLSMLFALGLLLAGAAHAQERDWMLDASEEDAYLIFGVPESDDVGVSLWCRIGKGAVNLYMPVPTKLMPKNKDGAAPLTITAGTETATLRGKADINREAAVSSIEAAQALIRQKALPTAARRCAGRIGRAGSRPVRAGNAGGRHPSP